MIGSVSRTKKHPRVRGEDQDRGAAGGRQRRNTPPGAGKTDFASIAGLKQKKHPRVRGEDYFGFSSTGWYLETPPRARGRLSNQYCRATNQGTTPVCAGKTCSFPAVFRRSRNHPRVRGEDRSPATSAESYTEPPPCARGRLQQRLPTKPRYRTTPACAGKTASHFATTSFIKNHPRVRGEDSFFIFLSFRYEEPPPRARRRRRQKAVDHKAQRNTPACAGKTR